KDNETMLKVELITMKMRKLWLLGAISVGLTLTSCTKDDDVPPAEHEHENITDVRLIFANRDDTTEVVVVRATDPDGQGILDMQILDTLVLRPETRYRLTFEIENNETGSTHD